MKKNPFGLDIGATTIKVASLSPQKDGFLLNAAISAQSPEKGMLSEASLDKEEMARAVKKVIDDTKIHMPYVVIALPENMVYTRVVEMPFLSDKELSSAIMWEAEQYIPVPLEEITLDYKILRKPEKPTADSKMDVLLVGAPTTLINRYDEVLSMAGLTVAAIETEILSAIRALILPNFPNTLIVHIGALSTSIAIVKDGILASAYAISAGGTAISRAIAADFGFSLSQAEEYKKTYGISSESVGAKIGQSTAPVLMTIVTEIKKALAFYNEKYKGESAVQQVLLSGGSAKLPGIDVFFAQSTGIETAIANPLHVLASQELPKDIVDNAPEYTIAIGLAMRDTNE